MQGEDPPPAKSCSLPGTRGSLPRRSSGRPEDSAELNQSNNEQGGDLAIEPEMPAAMKQSAPILSSGTQSSPGLACVETKNVTATCASTLPSATCTPVRPCSSKSRRLRQQPIHQVSPFAQPDVQAQRPTPEPVKLGQMKTLAIAAVAAVRPAVLSATNATADSILATTTAPMAPPAPADPFQRLGVVHGTHAPRPHSSRRKHIPTAFAYLQHPPTAPTACKACQHHPSALPPARILSKSGQANVTQEDPPALAVWAVGPPGLPAHAGTVVWWRAAVARLGRCCALSSTRSQGLLGLHGVPVACQGH